MNSLWGHEREPIVNKPPHKNRNMEVRGLLKSRRRRSSMKPTMRHATPKQKIASAACKAGPRAKPKRPMSSTPLRFVIGALLGVMLSQATHAGGCHSQDGARGHRRGAHLENLAWRHFARLAPCARRKSGIEATLVPKSGLRTADASVSGFDRKTGAAIPLERRAGVIDRKSV